MTDDLMQFLRARLDEEELWADHRGQASPRWYYDSFANEVRDHDNDGTVAFVAIPRSARHIARYDPARARTEIEIKRRILAEVVPIVDDAQEGLAFEYGSVGPIKNPLSRDLLKLLALPYADHPKYRPEWAPGPA